MEIGLLSIDVNAIHKTALIQFENWRQILDAINGICSNVIEPFLCISGGDSMNDLSNFKLWLTENKNYSNKVISNTVSRFKRAAGMLSWFNDAMYQYQLEQVDEYQSLSTTVRSQIKKAVKLYSDFINAQEIQVRSERKNDMKVLSLFGNIGVAETYLKEIGFDVVVANELIERRAILYSKIYPETHMI